MKVKSRILCWLLALSSFGPALNAQAAAGTAKIFLMTSTYGVMAGALAGLASLAFYSHPSEKTRNVAMGASAGLYAGILLGAYIVYWVPDSKKKKVDDKKNQAPSDNPLNLEGAPKGSFLPSGSRLLTQANLGPDEMSFGLSPTVLLTLGARPSPVPGLRASLSF